MTEGWEGVWQKMTDDDDEIDLSTRLLEAKLAEFLVVYYTHWLSRMAVSIK